MIWESKIFEKIISNIISENIKKISDGKSNDLFDSNEQKGKFAKNAGEIVLSEFPAEPGKPQRKGKAQKNASKDQKQDDCDNNEDKLDRGDFSVCWFSYFP